MTKSAARARLRFAALEPERWIDLEALFGANGACGGCWCMWWRQSAREFKASKGEKNRRAFRRLVLSGEAPGILAYAGDEPIGWCAVQPRAAYVRLATSRNLRPIDDEPVWSVPCFFVRRPHRRTGVTVQLLRAAVQHAGRHGARIVEGYPIEPGDGDVPAAFAWTGFVPAFEKAGFVEVARRSPRQPIMRITISRRASRTRAQGKEGGRGRGRGPARPPHSSAARFSRPPA